MHGLFLPAINFEADYLDKILAVSVDFSNLSLSSLEGLFNMASKAPEYGAFVLEGGLLALTTPK